MAALSNIECQYLRAPRSTFILCPKCFFVRRWERNVEKKSVCVCVCVCVRERERRRTRDEETRIIKSRRGTYVHGRLRDPIRMEEGKSDNSPFCSWPWSAFIFACNRKCCASLSRISTGGRENSDRSAKICASGWLTS